MTRRVRPQPVAGTFVIDTGTASLVPDRDGRSGWTVYVNGMESSHVDLEDPTRVDFEYLRWMADAIDVLAAEGEPLRVVHLGGGGCTLPRYVAATRPTSRQLVVELDSAVLELAKQSFGLRSTGLLRLRVGDARTELASQPAAGADVVVRDAFAGSEVPGHLHTLEFTELAARALRLGGVYLANVADTPRLELARREAAGLLAVFDHVALVAEPAQIGGRRYGNVVLAGSGAPLPVAAWSRTLASGAVRARLLDTDEVKAFAAGRRPYRDEPAPTPLAQADPAPDRTAEAGAGRPQPAAPIRWRVETRPWHDEDGAGLRRAQQSELLERHAGEPEPEPSATDIAVFVVAVHPGSGEAVACGALRGVDADCGEIKDMYVVPAHRGSGVAAAVLRALEHAARENGWRQLVLQTGAPQPESVRFYAREGFRRIHPYGSCHGGSSVCFGKELD
jgi:spermidine synthase/GNAT superfamily N-acetyltransferase